MGDRILTSPRKNVKHCAKFLLNCAQKCLQVYGVYPFIFAIGEPGTDIKSRVYVRARCQSEILMIIAAMTSVESWDWEMKSWKTVPLWMILWQFLETTSQPKSVSQKPLFLPEQKNPSPQHFNGRSGLWRTRRRRLRDILRLTSVIRPVCRNFASPMLTFV